MTNTGRGNPLHELDPRTPNVARAYNYLVGGSEHFAADRDLAENALAAVPEVRQMALENRALLQRMVAHLARRGIRRFLDVGAGLPCEGQVHEVAQGIAPDTRVVYVDYDPVVILQSQAMLVPHPDVHIVRGDVRDPAGILAAPEVRDLLAPGEPVALLLFAIMQFVASDTDAFASVAALVDALPPGSFVGLAHPTTGTRPEQMARIAQVYENTAGVAVRSPADIARFLGGLDMEPPGLVPVNEWAPGNPGAVDEHGWNMAGLARKPQ